MARKKNRLERLTNTERELIADEMNWKGQFVSKMEEGKALIKGAYLGYPCLVKFGKAKKREIRATVVDYLAKPDTAAEPVCNDFTSCGGCSLQHLKYASQCELKKQLFKVECSSLLDGIRELKLHPAPVEYGYRNKMEFTFIEHRGGEKMLGLHEQGRFQSVLPLETCWIQHKPMDSVFRYVSDWYSNTDILGYNPWSHLGVLRHLVLRGSSKDSKVLVNLVLREECKGLDSLYSDLLKMPEVSGVYETIHSGVADAVIYDSIRHVGGDLSLQEAVGHCTFEIGPRSFYQTNSEGMFVLYRAIERMVQDYCLADLQGKNLKLLDLYCGAGSIGIFLSRHFSEVIGIEEVQEAVNLASINAKLNGISNLTTINAQIENSEQIFDDISEVDVLVVDPPRSGCHPKARKWIRNLGVPWLIYVSCNPKTLEENLTDFINESSNESPNQYELVNLELVDLFPQTPHLESISLLRLKD